MISESKASSILARYKRYEEASKRFDPKRAKRGGGYTHEEIRAIEDLAGTRRPTNERALGARILRSR
jgi:hypothetical protein